MKTKLIALIMVLGAVANAAVIPEDFSKNTYTSVDKASGTVYVTTINLATKTLYVNNAGYTLQPTWYYPRNVLIFRQDQNGDFKFAYVAHTPYTGGTVFLNLAGQIIAQELHPITPTKTTN